jgi:hypothetical protein
MIHNVRFLLKRYPDRAPKILVMLTILSVTVLALGIGLLRLN